LTWFIGFSEGDGCFNVRDKGFSFSLAQDEKYVLTHIRDTLGFGKVSKFKDQEKWSYYVEKRYYIYLLILIFNGNLVLNHRYSQFYYFIDKFNTTLFNNKPYEYKIEIKERLLLPTLNDAWLSGFVDAEGHFGCPIETKRKHISHYISIVFEVGQNGEVRFFPYIQELLSGGLIAPKIQTEETHNRIIFKGYTKLGSIISYFDKYPLRSEHKLESYVLWKEMYKSLRLKEHLNLKLLPSLVAKAQVINKISKVSTSN